jgi:uncharacterized protein DUF11
MRARPLCRLILPAVVFFVSTACHDSDTTTAPGAIANLRIDAPDSARSGQSFTIDVSAVNVGINNIHNGSVSVTLPAPIQVASADGSSGTTATFSNGSGAAVTWTLNTLDSNSQSRLHINVMGVLAGASAAQTVTLRAVMTADGIKPGDAVAEHTVQLMP